MFTSMVIACELILMCAKISVNLFIVGEQLYYES